MRPSLHLPVLLLCALLGSAARASERPAAEAPAAASIAAAAATPATTQPALRSTPLRSDRAGRPVIGVRFNGKGPFDMVLDTAAQSSVISPALAAELGLSPLPGQSIDVVGVSGVQQVALFPVDALDSDLFSARDVALPGLPNTGSTSARGILGVEYFSQGKLGFNHREGRVTFSASSPVAAGSVALKGRLDETGLLHVPLSVAGIEVDALVDTGASTTVANWALLAALGWKTDDPRLKAAGGIRGATASMTRVMSTRLDQVQIGPAKLSNVPVVVTPPAAGGGAESPELILGIDVLGALATYAVDFPRAELQLGLPR